MHSTRMLPTKKTEPKTKNPRFLILFGKPKSGKTTIAADLDNNLIIDLEGGTDFLSALAIQARNITDIRTIAAEIAEKNKEVGGYFYKHITIDNVTRLEELCLEYAAQLYRAQPVGKTWTGTDVRTLPKGGGYLYLRQAVRKVIDIFRGLCEEFILIGHTKDATIKSEGEELSEYSLNLVGSLADLICGEADALGYVYRKKNETIISFEGGDSNVKGARANHIRNKRIVIATSDENDVITTHWDRIYLPEPTC